MKKLLKLLFKSGFWAVKALVGFVFFLLSFKVVRQWLFKRAFGKKKEKGTIDAKAKIVETQTKIVQKD